MSVRNQVIEFDHVELKGKLIRVYIDDGIEEDQLDDIKKIVKSAVDCAMKKGGAAILPQGVHIEVHSLV